MEVGSQDSASPDDTLSLLFWNRLKDAFFAAGGSGQHLELLITDKVDSALRHFVDTVVRIDPQNINSFAQLIAACRLDDLYAVALKPELIRGQAFHQVSADCNLATEPYPTRQRQTTIQIAAYFEGKMADLSQLLYFGLRKPEIQLHDKIAVVWRDEANRFWYAMLGSKHVGTGTRRTLVIKTCIGNYNFPVPGCRFLTTPPPTLF